MRLAHFEFDPDTDRLGEGPLSEVFKARDTRLDRDVALKILRPHAEIDPKAEERFEREGKHTARLEKIDGVTTIYEHGEDQGKPYIAMEFLEGSTLDRVIKERQLGLDEILRIGKQLAEILTAVHEEQLIHRDLKPANIMLHEGDVKLLDFGIARARDEASITQHGMLVGTVLYMSPEQVRGDDLDARSDVFSLGAVLYHLATGELPFPGESFPEVCMAILEGHPRKRPGEHRPGFPASLEQFLWKCMAPDPLDRYPNGGAAQAAFLAVRDELGGTQRRTQLEGTLVIPPISYSGPDREGWIEIPEWVRSDVAKSLDRNRKLEVVASPEGQSRDADYVLGMNVAVHPSHVDTVFELTRNGSGGPYTVRVEDRLTEMDDDPVVLAEDLASRGARTARRMLTEAAIAPAPDAPAAGGQAQEARRLALEARDILHRGRSRHVIMCAVRLSQAKEKDPFCAEAHAVTAEMLVSKYLAWDGDPLFLEESREAAATALRLDPQCALAHTALGFAAHIQGHTEDALREYRQSLQLDEEDAFTLRLLGALQTRKGRYKSAAANLQKAIGKAPWLIAAYDHLYVAYERLDDRDEAGVTAVEGIAAARQRLQEVPDDMDARMRLAHLYARLGRGSKARDILAEAQERAPKDGWVAFSTAQVLALIGDQDGAIESLHLAQDRGYLILSEIQYSPELEALGGRPEFDELFD